MFTQTLYADSMTGLILRELSANTAMQANSLELRPGQEQFETPVTYANADASLDHTITWSRFINLDLFHGESLLYERALWPEKV